MFVKTAQKVLGVPKQNSYVMIDAKASQARIKIGLKKMLRRVSAGDTIYFYYNGHGIPVPSQKNRPYLLAYDSEADFIQDESFFSLQNIYSKLTWYYHLSEKTSSYYVGYGQGKSEAEAKSAALHDIAKKISVTVNAKEHRYMNVDENDRLSKGFDSETTQTSSVKIHDYEVLKLEYDSGRYFAALGYDNIPSLAKFNRKLSRLAITTSEVQNRYLQYTSIAKKVTKKVSFSLKRKNGIWYIHYKDILQSLDEKDFSRFFATVDNPNLNITTNKRNDLLYNGDEFYFKIRSKKSGYITIFTVYEDGTAATLIRNVPIKKNRTENIPDKDFESVLQAGLIKRGVETFDLYVVVYSKNKKYFYNFARADEELLSDERYKNFDELIELLEDIEFVTLKVVTKPRM